jgi:cell filamentation protein, protein adenylyltransferase
MKQPGGFRAFVPAPLPPDPPVRVEDMQSLLGRAILAVGRLDGIAQTLPSADLFVAMYVRREAVLSSQIEGTQSTLEDLLAAELESDRRRRRQPRRDVDEVVNYVRAMNYGLARLPQLPLSLRLIREIHGELLKGVRGGERQPGDFRRDQNYIAPDGARGINEATFVPPTVPDMKRSLDNFEKWLHAEDEIPDLVRVGLAHAQFETIHPFHDGNGRVGRLLITFFLIHREVLHRPLLYLSVFLRRNRAEYYDRLIAVRDSGDWEAWTRFFLRGVAETAEEATGTVRAILDLQTAHRKLMEEAGLGMNGMRLQELLLAQPWLTVGMAAERLGVAFPTANRLTERFSELGLVVEVTGQRRNRVFSYAPYLQLFSEEAPTDLTPIQTTEAA